MEQVWTRRAALALALTTLTACAHDTGGAAPRDDARTLTGAQAWARLMAGNRRWAAGRPVHPDSSEGRRRGVASAQRPFAAVVSCIDSRVPPETVFDQGIGDLYAVRTGAASLDDLVLASAEYGPIESATPLVVVLGHERCGAVTAAVHALRDGIRPPGHLDRLVETLRPAYEAAARRGGDPVEETVREQVARTVSALTRDDALEPLMGSGRLTVTGALYRLESGQVTPLA
ncbi:carbonic anhydrase [Actinocorallia longicatena]|uniref:Carbonic anhydrase n=1 Tax=Actinocorallia longicatena TaxID=111803 RepID=A0ABP6QR37_9ACTN